MKLSHRLSLSLAVTCLAASLSGLSAQEPAKDDKANAKWDVNQPPYPTSDVTIDTRSGTWMSLDVSPDGREIVFDLLGDLYSLPISGGEARALTSGIAWDMQPRFSPDGQRIAFTSDRAGGDNIWIMDRDGSHPLQVTKESFRLLNSPAFSPDGDFLAAHKHFSSRRSLGAGEIWLFHRSGGEGLQMTKKPNDQKDLGEPAFSPDGRYVYFSQDTTPGGVFEYNKDPNRQIYVIQRLDRVTGEAEPLVTGPGGAIRPTPSPDGKSLAFIRRVHLKSVLFVRDLASGRERPVFEGLDRDMQETWAIHGVYPALAWTPDNQSLVFWAGGKIQRVSVSTRAVNEIPFRVKTTLKVAEALRFPQKLAAERFTPRMLRWVQVSPQGSQVVFQALGHLWLRDLPSGIPRRLTTQSDHFEHFPSWSRDGRFITYTSWNDETLGAVRVVPSRGGESRLLTREPGHYLEPVFAPDGSKVVYRKAGGGYVTSGLYSSAPGIYQVPVTGGTPTLVTPKGIEPHFGAGSDRLYLMTLEEEDKRALISIDLDGSDERAHFLSEAATQFRVSPDEKWLAFSERFAVSIVPFARTGKRVELGPKTKAIPVARVARDAGEYLHWSGNSRSLHWALGPTLFTRDLTDSFAFLAGAPEKLPEPVVAGVDISFETAADTPKGKLALVGGRLVTMRGDEVIEDGVVVIDGNRITAVGRRGEVAIPAGAFEVDAKGQTVLPGLVDVHWHGGFGENEVVPQSNWVTYASLAFGVTTLHDPSNDTSTVFAASELARAGLIAAPRIFSTGTILYGAAGSFKAEIEGLEDARAHLRRMKAVGAFSVKSYNQPRRDQRQQVIAAARELSMLVVPEGGSLYHHNMSMLVDGHTGIEHSLPVARIYDDVKQLWSQTKTGYTPTLVVGYGGLSGEFYWYQHTEVWKNERLLSFVPREIVDARARRRQMAAGEDDYNHFWIARGARELGEVGVKVNLGAHGQREGLGAHWELWMLAQGGMTPHQALRAATLNGAAYLGLDGEIGSLESGKLADIIVIDGNPLADIRQSEKVRYTMVNGRLYDAASGNQIGNQPRKRGKLSWEIDQQPNY